MQTHDITQLAAWLAATDIDALELDGPGVHLRLEREGAVAAAPVTTAASMSASPAHSSQTTVRAPSVGVFLDRIPGRSAALAPPGTEVQAGHLLGLLQIGALLLPVRAAVAGWLGEWCVSAGTTVGYGTPLVDIDTSAAAAGL
jgi:acetyl-CoA carboxylase biotin carboxyl carrier protein